jgi:hypothetical protein
MQRILLLALLAAPPAAVAQDPADLEARFDACAAGLDLDAIGSRAEAFTAERGYEARLAELCAAGDTAAAADFAAELEAEFYAQDPEAARMRACLVEILGEERLRGEDPCPAE